MICKKTQQKIVRFFSATSVLLAIFSCSSGEEFYLKDARGVDDYPTQSYRPQYQQPQPYTQAPQQAPYNPRQVPPYSHYYNNPYEVPAYAPVYDSDYYYQPPVRYHNVEPSQERTVNNRNSAVNYK